jgi:hypothetical protein
VQRPLHPLGLGLPPPLIDVQPPLADRVLEGWGTRLATISSQQCRSRHPSTPCRGFAAPWPPLGPPLDREGNISLFPCYDRALPLNPSRGGLRWCSLKPQPHPAHQPLLGRPPPLHPYALNLSADRRSGLFQAVDAAVASQGWLPPRGGAFWLSSPSAVACWRCTSSPAGRGIPSAPGRRTPAPPAPAAHAAPRQSPAAACR